MAVHHYMVEYSDENDKVQFANQTEMFSRPAAMSMALEFSKAKGSAYAVAYAETDKPGVYAAVGHVAYYNGEPDRPEGEN